MTDQATSATAAEGRPFERRVSRLREIARKRRQAKALHDCVLWLGAMPRRERDANNVSKEAAILDAEWRQMLADLPANVELSGHQRPAQE